MNTKGILEGKKTLLVNAIIVLSGFYPPIGEWVQAHPSETLQAVGIINLLLRFVTKGKVSLFNK